MSEFIVRDLCMRHTSEDGTSYVQKHRVWDADRFIDARRKAAIEAGGKAEPITEEQYAANRNTTSKG